jgi:hypothetical protein
VGATRASAFVVAQAIDIEAGLTRQRYAAETTAGSGTGARLELPSHTVLAGRILAAVAHEHHANRRSGDPYFSHTEATAVITRIAMLRAGVSPADPGFDLVQFIGYNHDNPEKNMDERGAYVSDPLHTTPLVAGMLLQKAGMPHGREAAMSTLDLAHQPDAEEGKLSYRTYNRRLIELPGPRGVFNIINKHADGRHNNKIDRETGGKTPEDRQRTVRNHERYDTAHDDRLNYARERGGLVLSIIQEIDKVTKEDLQQAIGALYGSDVTDIHGRILDRMESLGEQAA